MFKLQNKTILVISNEPWGDIWYSKHNWAFELSRENQVFFINPPARWSFSDLFVSNVHVEEYTDSLKILNYNNRIPLTRYKLPYQLNEFLISRRLKKWFKENNFSDYIYWTFDPYRFSKPQILDPIKSIYFRVDKYLVDREKDLIENIDVTIVTSEELLKDINVKKHLVLSHGISHEEFNYTNEVDYEEGYFLYVGNIDHRLDVELIKKMLIDFPNERFLFIGKKFNVRNALSQELFFGKKYENLILHGVEHFKNLKNFIYKSKACLVPMDLSVHGNAVHHHKSLQYLAMGKPVISPIFKDTINKDEFILGYKNVDEAILKIKELNSSETDEKVKNRIIFAEQFLYSNLIKKVETFLSK
jgi:hypothetical protein